MAIKKEEEKTGLVRAMLAVMNDVKGIDKSLTVGSGNFSYKGVSDKDVKVIIGGAMQKHGLVLLPIDVDANNTLDVWDETNGQYSKRKRSTFTEVKTKYLLMHTSGESKEVCGYGQGIDAGDKAAGKATTYALKYTLLYLFLTPTGAIEDTDAVHSENIPVAPAPVKKKIVMKAGTPEFAGAIKFLADGGDMAKITKKYTISEEVKILIDNELNTPA